MKFNFAQAATFIKTGFDFCKTHKRGIKKIVKWTFGTGAVVYGVSKAAETMRNIEEAGEKKGEALTKMEKAGIVVKSQAPAIAMAAVAVGADISLDLDAAKEIKTVTEENTSLLGQIAEIGNAYNTVNAVKEAFGKKLAETQGEQVVEEVKTPVVADSDKTGYQSIPVGQRAYVADRRILESWNDIYLRDGDVDYKVQEYYIPCVGQSILSCNHEITRIEKKLRVLQSPESGRGFITMDDFLEAIHARTVGGPIGENFVWRFSYETFGLMPKEMNLEGSAVFSLNFYTDPYYDREGMYYD